MKIMRPRLFWLPNTLSLSRGILAIPMFMAALNDKWVLGFWLLVAALVTDFFDGLAAKKLNAESKLGGNIDRVSDFILASLGGLGLALGAHIITLQWLWAAIPLSLFIGYVKFLTPEKNDLYRITSVFSVLLLFSAWAFAFFGFLGQAYGWAWWYLLPASTVAIAASLLKRHRFRVWFGWMTDRKKRV